MKGTKRRINGTEGTNKDSPKNLTQRGKVDDHETHKKHENFTEGNKENEDDG
jgi:hypothetical protein